MDTGVHYSTNIINISESNVPQGSCLDCVWSFNITSLIPGSRLVGILKTAIVYTFYSFLNQQHLKQQQFIHSISTGNELSTYYIICFLNYGHMY